MGNSNSGKVGTMRHQTHTVLFLLVCLATQAKLSEVVEGSGDEEFDQDAAINEAVNKVTELVTSWADNLEDLDLDLEINQEENEITDEKAAKRKRKCQKCKRKSFRGRNSEFCDDCQVAEQQEVEVVEVTTALTTPQSSNNYLKFNHNHNHRLINRRRKLEERCQKCTKNSFRARNDNFCSTKCAQGEADMEEVKTTTTTTTTSTTTSTTTEMMTTTTEMNKKVARCLSRCA